MIVEVEEKFWQEHRGQTEEHLRKELVQILTRKWPQYGICQIWRFRDNLEFY